MPAAVSDLRALESDVARESVRMALFGRGAPTRIGRYRVIGRSGRGAMGAVLHAHDPELDRPVALKLLEGRTDDPEALERLERRVLHEARAMARLRHPAVVGIYEVGRHGRWVFLAMEFIGGSSLRNWVTRLGPSWRQVLDAFAHVGQGLAAAHGAGLAHGDFKPDNLRFDDAGHLRILDFGLARSLSAMQPSSPVLDAASPVVLMRSMGGGGFGGTPAYASPERLDGQPADEASDQFSFFVSLYECLFAQRPFAGTTVAELRAAIDQGPATPPHGWTIPRALRRAIVRGLQADPTRRFSSMTEAAAVLRRIGTWRSARRWIAVGSVVLAGGVGSWLARPGEPGCTEPSTLAASFWIPGPTEIARARPARVTPEQWSRIESDVTDYAQRWADASHRACRSARLSDDPGLVAPELACLGHRRAAGRRLLQRLHAGDPSAWQAVSENAVELPDPSECDGVRLMQVPPSSPQIRDVVQSIRESLVMARVDAEAGDAAGALRSVAGASEQARALNYQPLWAEVAMLEGKLLADTEQIEIASTRLRDAYADAVASGHQQVAADTAVALVYVDGYQRARPELGHHWAFIADRLIQSHHDNEGLRASLVANEAAVWVEEGNFEAADAGFARALELEGARPRPNPFAIDGLEHNRGLMALRRGETERALEIFEETLRRRRALFGEDHVKVARARSSLAGAERAMGRFAEAQRHDEQALAELTRHHGQDSLALRLPLLGLLETHIAAGQTPQAQQTGERLLALLQRHLSADHPAVTHVVATMRRGGAANP